MKEIDFSVSRGIQQPCDVPAKPVLPDRETLVNSSRHHNSSPPTEIPPTVLHRSTVTEDALRVDNQSVPRGDSGVTLFVEIFARTNFRASALRENWKFSRVLIFAHLYIFKF